MSGLYKPSTVAIGCLIAVLWVRGDAQTNRELANKTEFIVRIDFACVTSRYPKRSLAGVVRAAMKGLEAGDIGVVGNRAIAFDLNKDGKAEYFIPLECGATGNCNWGIFGLSPGRRLATIPAQDIYIQGSRGWPVLMAYVHSSASDGLVSVYKYTGKRYVKVPDDFEVSTDRNDFPKSMEKVHSACEHASNEKKRVGRRRGSAHE